MWLSHICTHVVLMFKDIKGLVHQKYKKTQQSFVFAAYFWDFPEYHGLLFDSIHHYGIEVKISYRYLKTWENKTESVFANISEKL